MELLGFLSDVYLKLNNFLVYTVRKLILRFLKDLKYGYIAEN